MVLLCILCVFVCVCTESPQYASRIEVHIRVPTTVPVSTRKIGVWIRVPNELFIKVSVLGVCVYSPVLGCVYTVLYRMGVFGVPF